MNRTYIIIIGGILIFILLGGVLYFTLQSTPTTESTPELPKVTDINSPFGGSGGTNTFGNGETGITPRAGIPGEDGETDQQKEKLQVVSINTIGRTPISGAVAFKRNSREFVRYVEKGTGNIFERDLESKEAIRLTNTTIPKISEAIWSQDANNVYLRYIKNGESTITTFFASLPNASTTPKNSENSASSTTQTPQEIEGSFLGQDIKALATYGNSLFFLQDAIGAFGILSQLDGSKQKILWNSPLYEWNVSWPTAKTIGLTTKASRFAPGFFYTVDAKTGNESLVLQSRLGLQTLLNPLGTKVLYSEITNTKPPLTVLDLKTKNEQDVPFATLAEKCVWSNLDENTLFCAVPQNVASGDYPDDWYKGKVSFVDEIWKINLKTGETKQLLELKDSATRFDSINLIPSSDEKYLLFTNKSDSLLWSLRITDLPEQIEQQ